MSLTAQERILLDIIEEWQAENPEAFGPNLGDLEGPAEVLAAHGLRNMNDVAGLVAALEFKGLLVSRRSDGPGWISTRCWRLAGLLERLAHEARE